MMAKKESVWGLNVNLEQTAEERERWRDGEKERTHVCTFTRNYKYMYKLI